MNNLLNKPQNKISLNRTNNGDEIKTYNKIQNY